MNLSTLGDWLVWIASVHKSEIDLGLDRIQQVAANLDLLSPNCPIVIVGGTNGKGSTVAGLEAIYLAAGYRVGAFTSPFIFRYNEQVRVSGLAVSDEALCEAFRAVERARGEISLTPFEFGALASLVIFKKEALDVWLLEVGLGGRLDAVNVMDADVAVITSIGIDHVEWLGDTREKIAVEKAGIMRQGRPVVSGDLDTPQTLVDCAKTVGAELYCQGKEFGFVDHGDSWEFRCQGQEGWKGLPVPALAMVNMATVLMTVRLLQSRLPVTRAAIDKGMATVALPGRIQVIEGPVKRILDVSHNPASVAFLVQKLLSKPFSGKTYGVFSMLADKDIEESIQGIKHKIDEWWVAPLAGVKRGATPEVLEGAFKRAEIHNVVFSSSLAEAYQQAVSKAKEGDRIIVFGSFHTVAEVCSTADKNDPLSRLRERGRGEGLSNDSC